MRSQLGRERADREVESPECNSILAVRLHSGFTRACTMLALQNFLRLGVRWVGPDADSLSSRRARLLLEHLARRVRHDRPHAGVRLTPADMADRLYSRRNASYAIADLVKAGIITRERSRVDKSLHEDVALTIIHPALITAAASWSKAHGQLKAAGKKGRDCNPPAIEIRLPLISANRCIENPSNHPTPSANPHGIRLGEGAACNPCTQQHAKNAQTGIPLPPQESDSDGGAVDPDAAAAVPAVHTPAAPAAGGQWPSLNDHTPSTKQQSVRESFLSATLAFRKGKVAEREKIDQGAL